jgi:hypothetical protein
VKKTLSRSKILFFQTYIAFLSLVPTEVGIRLRYYAYKPLFKKTAGMFRIDTGVTIYSFKNIELGSNINIMKNSYLCANDGGHL